MSDRANATIEATKLMQQAIALLDTTGEQMAAAWLQHALDILQPAPDAFQVDDPG